MRALVQGGALVNSLEGALRHGKPFVAAYRTKLLQQVAAPLLTMIRSWVFEGVLHDRSLEFFVRKQPSSAGMCHAQILLCSKNAIHGPLGQRIINVWRSDAADMPSILVNAFALR